MPDPTDIPEKTEIRVVESLADREARNPTLRWLLHFGMPMGASFAIHLILFVILAATGWAVAQRANVDVGEYEAGITEGLGDKLAEGFKWPGEEEIKTPETDLSKLDSLADLTDLTNLDSRDMNADQGLNEDSSLGFGEGRGDILGLGTGAGEAGTGGFGGGLGSGRRAGGGAVGLWGEQFVANKVAYVIDFSGSIIVAHEDLVRELKKSVSSLKAFQSFNAYVFFSTPAGKNVTDQFAPGLQAATPDAKRAFFSWIDKQIPQGGTEPLAALLRAIKIEPDVVIFLSDGYFDEPIVEEIAKANRRVKARFLCFVFDEILLRDVGGKPRETDGAKRLQRIARDSNGKTKIVTGADLDEN